MRIISKYKDYCDYLQGIYGVDEKLILDRTKGITKNFPMYEGLHVLVICGKVLEYVCSNSKFYFGDDIAQFNQEVALNKWGLFLKEKPTYIISTGYSRYHGYIHYPKLSDDVHNKYPELKELSKKCPIFIHHVNSKTIWQEFPSLLELGINKHIPAKDMWIMLSEWLGNRISENEPIVPVGDDKVRIQSAGFDLKTSFRH